MQRGSQMSINVNRAYGPVVEGEAVVSEEGFSPRYDLDRWTGLITKPGHKLEGTSIVDKICFFPTAKGGIAAGLAFYDIQWKKIAPKALVFRVTNPVMGQSAISAGTRITEGGRPHPREVVKTGDWVRAAPANRRIETLRRERSQGGD